MEENYLAKADVRRMPSKKQRTILIVYLLVVALILALGLIAGSSSHESKGGRVINSKSPLYGQEYPASVTKWTTWFGLILNRTGEGWVKSYPTNYWGDTSKFYVGNVILLLVFFGLLTAAPLIIFALHKRQCENTALMLTHSHLLGSHSQYLGKKALQIPIEWINKMTARSELMDTIRGGKTLTLFATSGTIRFRFIHNAEEFVAVTMGRVQESREKMQDASKPVEIPYTAPQTSSSTLDKINELVKMKEAGLITEEEFTDKKRDLLDKM